MSSKARVTAALDMEISGFRSGLDKANTFLEVFKRNVKHGDLGNGIKSLFGAGVFIEGFRAALDHARELRKEAQETGRQIDKWTAAAARFSDVLVGGKAAGAGLLTKGMGALNIGGEKVGDFAVWLTNKLGINGDRDLNTERGEAAQQGAEDAEGRLARARKNIPESFMRDHNRQLRGMDRQEKLIGATEPEQIAELRRQAAELRNEAGGLKRPEDFTEKKKLELEARKIEVDAAQKTHALAEQKRKSEEKRWDFLRENTTKEETTAEKIARLRAEADRAQKRALDTTRDLSERDDHRMKMLEKTAQAAKLEYEWKNKPLTVAEAAANTATGRRNTTSVGIAGRRITQFQQLADRARAQGRYRAAAEYDAKARMATEEFEKNDRAGRQTALAGAAPSKDSWDARNGAQLAARNASLNATYGGAFKRPESFEKSNIERSADNALKEAAAELKSAAEDIKAALTPVDTED